MGDPTIAQDLLEGVADVMAEVGETLNIRVYSGGTLNLDNPGAGPTPRTFADTEVEGFLYDYEDKYIDGTVVKVGDRQALLSIKNFPFSIIPGMRLVDSEGRTYNIVKAKPVRASGTDVTTILQIRS